MTPRPFTLGLALLLAVGVPFAEAQTRRARGKETQLQQNLRSIREQKAALRRELRANRRRSNVVVSDIAGVDDRLTRVRAELDDTKTRLERGRLEQARLVRELSEATERLASVRDRVRRRLRAMYVVGPPTVLSALAGSTTVGELASRQFLMQRIAEQDRALFQEYRDLRAGIARRKARQDALVVETRQLQAAQARQEGSLEELREEKEDVLEALKARQGKILDALRQFEADERSIAAQIAAFARRSRRPGSLGGASFTGRFSRPIDAPLTSGFGTRYHPILKVRRLHTGADFGAPSGTPIRAAADGVVVSTAYLRGYGNTVILDHGGGYSTVYAHCSAIYVSPNQSVARGDRIAAVGSTGLSTGPHLHFEVRVNGVPVNPLGKL